MKKTEEKPADCAASFPVKMLHATPTTVPPVFVIPKSRPASCTRLCAFATRFRQQESACTIFARTSRAYLRRDVLRVAVEARVAERLQPGGRDEQENGERHRGSRPEHAENSQRSCRPCKKRLLSTSCGRKTAPSQASQNAPSVASVWQNFRTFTSDQPCDLCSQSDVRPANKDTIEAACSIVVRYLLSLPLSQETLRRAFGKMGVLPPKAGPRSGRWLGGRPCPVKREWSVSSSAIE